MKKIYSRLLAGLLFVLVTVGANAQIAVTVSGTAVTVPALAPTYTSLANALTALNSITSYTANGTIIFTCTAGGNETNATATGLVIGSATLNPLLSATNTVLINKSGGTVTLNAGVGVNAAPSTATPDCILKLTGADYITIDGLTFTDGNSASATVAMEVGLGFFKLNAGDGCNNNTIQNCTFNMQRISNGGGTAPMLDGSWAIEILNSTDAAATTALTPTNGGTLATNGTNSGNKFYSNTINNGNGGIGFGGYAAATGVGPSPIATTFLGDLSNDVGGVAAGTGNTILNFGGGAATSPAAGIRANNEWSINIQWNTINSNNGGGVNHATTLRGIYGQAGISANVTISNNTITVKSGATTSGLTGIDNSIGITAAANTVNITNNTITGCTYSTATSGVFTGITNTASAATVNINSNILTSNATNATSGTTNMIVNSGAATVAVNMNSNNINGMTYNAATSGAFVGVSCTSTGAAAVLTMSSNNIQAITYGVLSTAANTYLNCSAVPLSFTANLNTFTNLNINTTGTTTFILMTYTTSTGTGTKTVNNNSIVTAFNRAGASGSTLLISDNGSSIGGTVTTVQNNNFSNMTVAGTSTITGINLTDGGTAPTKSITGNTFNGWTAITGAINVINITYWNGVSSLSTNTITNITGQAAVTGITIGAIVNTATSIAVASNTITNLTSTGTGGTVIGISCSNTSPLININGNTINTLSSTNTSGVISGISIGGAATTNIFKNKIYDLSGNQTGTTINGINITSGTNLNIHNNLIGDLRATAATGLNAINGINASASSTYNVYYNTIYLNAASTSVTTFGTSCINFSSTATSFNSRNNILYNSSTPAQEGLNVGTNGIAAGLRRSSGTAATVPTNYATTSNNNAYWVNPTAGTNNHLTYVEGTGTITNPQNAVTNMKTFMGNRDQASVQENVSWQSTTGSSGNFLKYNTGSASQIESGAVNIATYTDDYIGTIRQGNGGYLGTGSAPDIGAWELEGIAADLTGPTISYTTLANTSCLTDRTLSPVTITDASGVNIIAGTRPRLYYKKSTDANTFNDNTNGTAGWKFVEATGAGGSPFSFITNYSLLNSAPVILGDVIQYFVVAQDNVATPNVGINSGTFAANPASVALTATAFPLGGTINSYTLVAAGLSGTVTIGAAGTYTSITQAAGLFNDINTKGLSGNLIVNILDASVAETGAIALNAIGYNGCAVGPYTVLIKPNTTSVLTGTVNAGSLIKLNGADYVTIDGSNSGSTDRSLTIQNLTATTSGNAVIWLASPASGNGAINNTIKNCIIEGNSATTSFLGMYVGGSATISLVAAGNELNSNNTISNNLFRKTQYGLALFGYAAGVPDLNNVISNNNFGTSVAGEGFALGAINTDRQQNLIVSGNEVQNVTNSTSTTSYFGIRLLDFKNGLCYNNKVHDLSYTGVSTPKLYGIAVTSSTYATVGNPSQGQVYNNAVYKINSTATGATWNVTGILAGQGYGDKYYYNSVSLTGQVANSSSGLVAAFANGDANLTATCTNIDVRDNSFSLTGSSATAGGNFWAYYSTATTLAGSTINYNDLYCNGTGATNNVARLNSINYATLGAWQAAPGTPDLNSIAADPLYNSTTNLAPQLGSPLLSAATPIGGITSDIIGAVRSATTPTIGAYEVAGDLAAPTITYTALTATCSTGDRTLTATIVDASGVPTSGALQPRIYYKKNAGGWFSSQGVLSGGTATNGTWTFTIVAADMGGVASPDVISYFVIAQDVVATPNIGSNPAAGLVATDVNTISTYPTSPNTYTIQNTLAAGTYTVGVGQTYTTLTAAVNAYNTSCLGGAIVFQLMDANYSASETFPISVNANANASAVNTLTIRPGAAVTATITGSVAAGSIIKLNGADYVTIDGSNSGSTDRSLTIENTTATISGNAVVWLASPASGNGATNNTIKNCIIQGNTALTTFTGLHIGGSTTIGLVTAGTELNSNNTINNNLFRKTQYGATLFGYAAVTPDLNNVISNNNFGTAVVGEGFSLIAINADRQSGLVVSGNEIQNVTNATTSATFVGGMRLLDFKNGLCYNNKVHDLSYTGTSTPKYYGIGVTSSTYTTVGNPSNAQVYNNIVYKMNSTGTSGVWNMTGILASAGYGDKFYYNSVHLTGQLANSSSGLVAAFANGDGNISSVCTNIDVRDNSFSLTGSSATAGGNFWAYYSAATTLAGSTLNYNDLYCNGTGATNNVGRFNGLSYTTLAAWQAATGQEANSIAADPLYNSTTNLIPQLGSPLIAAATPIGGITNDIIGAVRNATTPTIGAYEQAGDFAAPTITYTVLSGTCSTGDRTLTATIIDASGVPTLGVLQPRIYYKKNAGGWFSSQGVLSSGTATNGTWTFTIVAANMGGVANPDVISYFVIAQDVAATPNITSNPAAGLVATDVNTITTYPTTPNTYTIQNTLAAGTYTVGVGQTYTTLTAAVTAYNTSCLGGAIVFQLMDANYSASETFPITVNPNASANAVNTLTIRPGTGVTTTVSGTVASGALLKILGNYVIIDGSNNASTSRDLTITNASITSPNVIVIGSTGVVPVTNVTVKNSIIINGVNTSSAVVVSDGATVGTAGYFSNIAIDNNSIQKAYIGIYNIAVVAAANGTGLNITGNDLSTSGANAIRYVGIYVQGVDGATVQNNTIGNFDGTSSENDKGIWFATGTVNSTINRNKIFNLNYTGTGGYGGQGVYISSGVSPSNVRISNNMISNLSGDGWSYSSIPLDNTIGICLTGTQTGINIYYNSINLYGNTLNQTSAMSMGMYLGAGSVADIRDNIIVNNLGLLSATGYGTVGIYAVTNNAQFAVIDYNDFYVNPSGTGLKYIGQIAATGSATLALWQTATAQSANSLNIAPNFTAPTDLHLVAATNCRLDGYGTPIAGITTDYDLQTRDAGAPDMGVDEFITTPAPSTMTTASNCDTKNVSPLGTLYLDGTCNLIAKVLPSGGSAVTGKIKTCTTLDGSPLSFNGQPYVQRHYDIEPSTSPSTATGTITLYFTDAEFALYNTNNPAWPPLPTVASGGNASIYLGNVKVTQFHGVGSTSPTSPGNYPGTTVLITPVTKFFNGTFWELTFNVTGFSGFYVHTNGFSGPLPVIVNYLTGRRQGSNHLLNWKVTCTTSPRATMTLERSADSRNYTGINTITADAARCQQPFDYTDANPLPGMNYYRLKIVDADGKVTYSTTVALLNAVKGFDIISIAPNPVVTGNFKLNVASAQASKMELIIFDMQGRLVNRQSISVIAGYNSLPINVVNLSPGTYTMQATITDNKSRVIRFVKQ